MELTKSRVAATNLEDALLYLIFNKTLSRKSGDGIHKNEELKNESPGMRLRTHMSATARCLKEVTHGSTCLPLSVVTMFSIVGKRKYTSKTVRVI